MCKVADKFLEWKKKSKCLPGTIEFTPPEGHWGHYYGGLVSWCILKILEKDPMQAMQKQTAVVKHLWWQCCVLQHTENALYWDCYFSQPNDRISPHHSTLQRDGKGFPLWTHDKRICECSLLCPHMTFLLNCLQTYSRSSVFRLILTVCFYAMQQSPLPCHMVEFLLCD